MNYFSVQPSLNILGKNNSTYNLLIKIFSELIRLLIPINLERFDERSCMEASMMSNKVMWHKLCCNKFKVTSNSEHRRENVP